MEMPKGRPDSAQHTKSLIMVGIAQGLMLTLSLFLLIVIGL